MPGKQQHVAYQYLRHSKKFPHVWCPGCGIGIVMGAIIRAVNSLALDQDRVAIISGIGCTSRMPVYMDFNTMHTTHGRALAFATGLKLVRPDMTIIVVMGDGDALAIGGNHFIHAARRNIGLTSVIVNNYIYGMTGGQVSPVTPLGMRSTTAPYGNIDPPFPIADLSIAAGAAFVARSTVYHAHELEKYISTGLQTPGFAVIEAVSNCHTTYGRINKLGGAVEMMRHFKNASITKQAAEKLSPEELEGRIVRGVFYHDSGRKEYSALYREVQENVGGASLADERIQRMEMV
jgi:2-oxoglutarate ferredoxin oxidoreductase subunit beta